MTTDTEPKALARGILESVSDEELVLAIPHTDYRLHLVPTVPAGEFGGYVGKRISGVIQATALRIHRAQAGGRFIEPVWGAPRIVAGTVCTIDKSHRRVLVDVSVPMWVTVPAEQDFDTLCEEDLVNFYVQSGTTFRPVITS